MVTSSLKWGFPISDEEFPLAGNWWCDHLIRLTLSAQHRLVTNRVSLTVLSDTLYLTWKVLEATRAPYHWGRVAFISSNQMMMMLWQQITAEKISLVAFSLTHEVFKIAGHCCSIGYLAFCKWRFIIFLAVHVIDFRRENMIVIMHRHTVTHAQLDR